MTNLLSELFLLSATFTPLIGSLVCLVSKRGSDERCKLAGFFSWLAALSALIVTISVGLRGPFIIAADGVNGQALFGLWANQLTASLALLVTTVGAVVQSFSLRYLQGDHTTPKFTVAVNVVITAMVVVCTSLTVPVLIGAWVLAGIAFTAVLGCRPDLPGVRQAMRSTSRMLAIGDFGLVVALIMLWVRAGNINLGHSGALKIAAGQLGMMAKPVALLIAMAALSRSAQGPFGKWLPTTVSAPTPASALLHAGVVNGGGILLVRLGILTGGSMAAMVGVFILSGLTATVAAMLMTHKPDIKGSLVFSTMSQMGFMLAECSVGAYLAAVVHLIGHGLYKATLFFGSGSQVPRLGQEPTTSTTGTILTRILLGIFTVVATVGVMIAVPGILSHRGAVVLLVFAAATVASASWAWSERRPSSTFWLILWSASTIVAGSLYGLLLTGLGRWIEPALPATGQGVLDPWWLLAVAVAGVSGTLLSRSSLMGRRLRGILVNGAAPSVEMLAKEEHDIDMRNYSWKFTAPITKISDVNGKKSLSERVKLLRQIDRAARVIAPLWPLSTFIAVNPLWELRHLSFDDAVSYAGRALGITGYPSPELFRQAYIQGRINDADLSSALLCDYLGNFSTVDASQAGGYEEQYASLMQTAAERHDSVVGSRIADVVDREVSKWCAAYLANILPDPENKGFYSAWQEEVINDQGARQLLGRSGAMMLANLGSNSEDAILASLELLGVTRENQVEELTRHFARMPGWAGYAKWRSRWAASNHQGPSFSLIDYLAVRLCYEAVLVRAASSVTEQRHSFRINHSRYMTNVRTGYSKTVDNVFNMYRMDIANIPDMTLSEEKQMQLLQLNPAKAAQVWLIAYENHYRDQLLTKLSHVDTTSLEHPEAQAVFCIDVRSEGLRRHLESSGRYETFGFAGFFALPIRYRPWGAADTVDLCPVLVRPSIELREQPVTTAGKSSAGRIGLQALSAIKNAFSGAKKGTLSPFILAEASGFVAGPISILKTMTPTFYQTLRGWVLKKVVPPVPTTIDVDPLTGVMSDEEQALFAETALSTMGLISNFAPVVLLCGHGSTTENNPYASSLDCGACGGNRGGVSARAAVAILNRRETRDLLAERGITIPKETIFVAGEHDTATDTVTIFDTHLISPSHLDKVTALQAALNRAGKELAAERARALPGTEISGQIARPAARSTDWAQVRPEWGLARNTAFIVAPRSATMGLDLERRCFLHSYDSSIDPDGISLETILTAPMVVAHWINAQYYFSTVDPDILSAGDKTAHNIVAGTAVVQGAGGDLKVGLPMQSLFDGDSVYHEPMRLLSVVQAPIKLLDKVIARNSILRELFDGQWVHLAARENPDDEWKIRYPNGTWVEWTPAGVHGEEITKHG